MRRLWNRSERSSRVALIVGVVLAVAAIPLPTLVALAVGLIAAAVLGYSFPDRDIRVGVIVAMPILSVAFLAGLVRGFSSAVLLIFLGCSLILPIALARLGANARRSPRST